MIDYLFSSLPPGKGADLAEAGLSSIMANIAFVVGVIILKPAIERHIHPAILGHTPTSLDNRQFFKLVLGRRDLLSPAVDGLSTLHLKVKPTKPTIATAVTVVKAVPSPVQIFQEQSSFLLILGIIACMVLALAGTVLAFQHHRQGASWSSQPLASSDNSDSSSLEPYSRNSTPPNDYWSDESSGSGGQPPPVLVLDVFHDFPILHLNKAVGPCDEQVRDEDGAPPPPPPSFPTPVEDGDASPSKPFISKWLPLTLVLSIISLVIKRFFKGNGKTQNEASTPGPTVSERITLNEISGDFVTLFPSATLNPVINTCPDPLSLVEIETKPESLSVSTLVMSTISQCSRKFMITVFSVLFMSCLFGLPFFAQYFLDYHLQKPTNTFRKGPLDEITVSVPVTVSSLPPSPPIFASPTNDADGSDEVKAATVDDEESDDLPLALTSAPEIDDTGSDEVNNATGGNEKSDDLMKNSVQFFHNEKTSSFTVDSEDVFVFSSDEVPVSNRQFKTSSAPSFKLPTTEGKCTVNGKGIKVLSEHVPKSNIPVFAKKVQTDPVVPARSHTLPIYGAALVRNSVMNKKPFSMESLNPEAASFVPQLPQSHVPVRRKSSSTNLNYRHSPPSPTGPGLSGSIHAPLPQRRGLSASILQVVPISLSEEDLCDSIYTPSSPPPRPDSSASINVPSSPPRRDLSASIHAPCMPPKRSLNASIHAPRTASRV